jgi:hypothetical protein
MSLIRFARKAYSRLTTHHRCIRSKLNGLDESPQFEDRLWVAALTNLRLNGFAKLPISIDLPQGVDPAHLSKGNEVLDVDGESFLRLNKPLPAPDKFGKSKSRILFASRFFKKLLSNDLHTLIHCYYGTNLFWIRSDPALIFDQEESRKEFHGQRDFHLDHATHQLSMMIFLNDCDSRSTRTTLIPGTQKRLWPEYDFVPAIRRDSQFFRRRVQRIQKNLQSKDIIGKQGECFIFDAGNCLHKAVYGSNRFAINMIFATSTNYSGCISPAEQLDTYFSANSGEKRSFVNLLEPVWLSALPF